MISHIRFRKRSLPLRTKATGMVLFGMLLCFSVGAAAEVKMDLQLGLGSTTRPTNSFLPREHRLFGGAYGETMLSQNGQLAVLVRFDEEFSLWWHNEEVGDASWTGVGFGSILDGILGLGLELGDKPQLQLFFGVGLTGAIMRSIQEEQNSRSSYQTQKFYATDFLGGLVLHPEVGITTGRWAVITSGKYRYFFGRRFVRWETSSGCRDCDDDHDSFGTRSQSWTGRAKISFAAGSFDLFAGFQLENWRYKSGYGYRWPQWPKNWERLAFFGTSVVL